MIQRVYHQGVDFRIEDGCLLQMSNASTIQLEEIVIPSVFSSGERITSVGPLFCQLSFKKNPKIIIDDDISIISKEAFRDTCVEEVVWPASCTTIPYNCFFRSRITKITNIEHVTSIEDFAFFQSDIKEMVWPEKCSMIPLRCFASCTELTNISVPDSITEIAAGAFESCSFVNFRWPGGCREIPSRCFYGSMIETVDNLSSVVSIKDHAFARCYSVADIDLSSSIVSSVGHSAFFGVRRERVSTPYYMNADEFDSAFSF